MRKLIVVILCVAAIHTYELSCKLPQNVIAEVKELVAVRIDSFDLYLHNSFLPAAQQMEDAHLLKQHLLRARLLYKQIEWATEYFMPATTRFVNGAPLPEIENEENKIFEPEGLQVIEGLIYSDSVDYNETARQVRLLGSRCNTYKKYWEVLAVDSSQIADALKLQVFRMITLGISGFDAALAESAVPEAKATLQSLREASNLFYGDETLRQLFDRAIVVAEHTSYDDFDRLDFIKNFCDPLTSRMVEMQKKKRIAFVNSRRLLRSSAASLFQQGAFDVNAYAPDSSYFTNSAREYLGRKLFFDPVLSSSNTVSCASCHDPAKGFSDGLAVSVSLTANAQRRNTPGLLNAALQPWQFYDMRATNLENQSRDVIESKDEMHGDLSAAALKLEELFRYRPLFKDAFAGSERITPAHIQNAIASYIRSLTLLNSRFDKYMRNDKEAMLTAEEKSGFNIFMGKGKCGTCHFAPLFNGTVPPAFTEMDSEVIGVPANKNFKQLDDDPGRYGIYALAPYRNAFKTTTVRNAAITAPYMHNGVFTTLEEVIDFYDKGGGAGVGLDVPNQTLPFEKLQLTDTEKRNLVAFLKSLTDSQGKPN